MSEPEWVVIWRKRLDDLRTQLATAVGPDEKFAIRIRITEAEAELAKWTPPAEAEPKQAPTRLGRGAPTLFGRDDVLARFDSAWTDPQIKLMTIVAWGGVGKTALVHEFRNRLARRDEFAWVFDWSFYSQGTRDVGAVSADSFIREALLFFGDPALADSNASAWRKGERLAELVGSRRALLILDGLEPLQEPPAAKGQAGAVREQSVRALLLGLASRNRGLCLARLRFTPRRPLLAGCPSRRLIVATHQRGHVRRAAEQPRLFEARQQRAPRLPIEPDQRIRQPSDRRLPPQRRDAAGIRRPIEQPHHAQHRELPLTLDSRLALYAARLHATAPTLACTLTREQAREQLEAAVDTLREAGYQDELPKGLLTRAWLHHLCQRDDLAERDLDDAWALAIRGPMPLFQADIQLHRARLFHDRDALAQAATLIAQLGYHRRLGELHDAQAQLSR